MLIRNAKYLTPQDILQYNILVKMNKSVSRKNYNCAVMEFFSKIVANGFAISVYFQNS
jgi:hypothetical protein